MYNSRDIVALSSLTMKKQNKQVFTKNRIVTHLISSSDVWVTLMNDAFFYFSGTVLGTCFYIFFANEYHSVIDTACQFDTVLRLKHKVPNAFSTLFFPWVISSSSFGKNEIHV